MVDVEKEMMKEIMADYHSGDPRKVASAKEQILNKAQRLITFMIKKYFPTYIPRYYDELYQECMVALYDAIPKFNPERATLSTYLTKPLHRAMSAYIHSLTNRSNSYYGKQMDDVRHAITFWKQRENALLNQILRYIRIIRSVRFMIFYSG